MKIKICGITNVEDARMAWESGADALGFVLYRDSPRYVKPESVKSIIAGLPPFVITVGVFVNEEVDTVRSLMEECGLFLAQLHGDESPDYCLSLHRSVLKGIRLRDRRTFLALAEFQGRGSIRGFVIDAFSDSAYGGTGTLADWALAAEVAKASPVVLAGGLTPDNVQGAIRAVRPYGVDVSSGVEKSPGKKDPVKIQAFIHAVKLVS